MTMIDVCRAAVLVAMNTTAVKACFYDGPCPVTLEGKSAYCTCADAFVAATIEALMEPTDIMTDAGANEAWSYDIGDKEAGNIFEAMLKAALEETK